MKSRFAPHLFSPQTIIDLYQLPSLFPQIPAYNSHETIHRDPLFLFFLSFLPQHSHSQQSYENNRQLACYEPNAATNGYVCNNSQPSCVSYLTFRAQPPYDSASQIGYLLNADPTAIAQLNNITDVGQIPTNTLIMVPINCSCSGNLYQHNTTYTLKDSSETYFSVANDTLQGLSTCQALMNENPYDSRNLSVRMRLEIPLRCACPTRNQIDRGFQFLLSYLVTWGDDIPTISGAFGVDDQSTREANQLSETNLIFPFTTLLIPLRTQPTYRPGAQSPPASSPPTISIPGPEDSDSSSSDKKGLYIGIGIGSFVLVAFILGSLYWFLVRRKSKPGSQSKNVSVPTDYTATANKDPESGLLSPINVRLLIDSSLKVYDFEELQSATGHFSEANRIRGAVYRGVINGDDAAIKRMKRDALNEINVLKQIFHSSIIRLSGYCMHEGNVYFVYEFAENGSLSDWLHDEDKSAEIPGVRLSWKQRIQIAYDVADGLNYLHNYATPPYIHRDLKSSNILLNGSFRAKIANFGMARAVDSEEMEGAEQGLQLTRHVVGTQGYMAPEYLENGVVSPKMDVFAFGVVMLELLSGKEAATFSETTKGELLLFASINQVIEGENVREKLKGFIDPSLKNEYPLDLAFSFAILAKDCVTQDMNSRPTMFDAYMSLSKIVSSSLDWDPSDEFQRSSMVSNQ